MADWVLKGSLKGPQGDPGADAQLPEGGTTGQVLTKTADGEAWQDAPQPDLTGYAYLHPSEDKTINPDTVDIRTLEPGVYRVAMGSYVDNGEMVDVGVNNTQFPDAMVHMTPYGVDRTGILTVSKTVRNDDSGNEMLFYDLQIGYPMGDGEVDRFIAQCPSPGYALDSGNWKQIPKDSDIPKYFLVISSDGNLKEFNGGPVDELAVGLATENNRASMGYFNYLGTTGVNFVAKRDDDRQAFMQASGSSSHVEVAHSGNQIGIGASAGGAFIAVKPNGGTATQYSISDAIADGTNTLATGKAVADYVAANAGGGGLELLWEGSGASVVVSCDLTDYALLACVAQNTYDGSYGQGLIRPIPLGANQALRINGQTFKVTVSNNSEISTGVGSVSLRYIYGFKASGGA